MVVVVRGREEGGGVGGSGEQRDRRGRGVAGGGERHTERGREKKNEEKGTKEVEEKKRE